MSLETELKEAIEGIGTRFEEFKKENDKAIAKGVKDALAEAKLAQLSQSIDDLTGKREDLEKRIKSAEAQAAKVADLEAQLKTETGCREEVERKLNLIRVTGASDAEKKTLLRKHVNTWARGVINSHTIGVANLTDEQRKAIEQVAAEYKALTITDDTTGGYLAPVEYVREIIKGVTLISPVREIVRVRTTAAKGIQLPKRTSQFAARRTSEVGSRTETTGLGYGMVEIDAPEMYALIDISQQNLEDSAFDLESEIRMESEEQFAVKEGAEFVSGSGLGECEGIVTNCNAAAAGAIPFTVSGTAATIADASGVADGIITLFHTVKTQYARQGQWILNRLTLGAVRKLKDTNKQYIWQPGLAQGVPNTILSAPYTEVPDMPSEGANNFPIGFGDWKRAYTLLDRIGMSLLRDPYTQATSGMIRFLMRRRVGGRVVLGEAVRLLKCST